MQLLIPPLGTKILLGRDWTFQLFYEQRNASLLEHLGHLVSSGYKATWQREALRVRASEAQKPWVHYREGTPTVYPPNWYNDHVHESYNPRPTHETVTLPAGSLLVLDRIYIRKNQDEFDSVSFVLKSFGGTVLKKTRFWAKLYEVNRIEASVEFPPDYYQPQGGPR